MNKDSVPVVIVLMGALVSLVSLPLSAQKADNQKADKATSILKIGAVSISFNKFFLKGSQAHLSAGVQMTSEQYDLTAEDVLAVQASGQSGHSGLARATAEGSLAKKTQVTAHIKQPLEGKDVEVFSDRAVYVPDYSRPAGGRIDFTGHVKVVGMSGFLAGPAPADFQNGPVTILLGQGDDYPQIQTGPGHIVVTPAR